MNKKIDFVLILLIVGHLLNRTWPYGDTMQTITDIIFGIAVFVIGYRWIFYKR